MVTLFFVVDHSVGGFLWYQLGAVFHSFLRRCKTLKTDHLIRDYRLIQCCLNRFYNCGQKHE